MNDSISFLVLATVLLRPCCAVLGDELVRGASSTAKVTVYLLAGQSNMVGSGTPIKDLPAALRAPQSDVRFYYAGCPGKLKKNAWVSLQPGGSFDFGPEITFGRGIADSLPQERIALIKYATGNTNLAENWNPDTGPMYQGFKSTVEAALKSLVDREAKYQIAGMVWMQGESDAYIEKMAMQYETHLTNFIARVRHDFNTPQLPLVIGRIFPGSGTSSNIPFAKTVRAAQVAVAERDSRIVWVDLDGLPQQDAGAEFNGPGTIEMGRRFAAAMKALHGLADQLRPGNK